MMVHSQLLLYLAVRDPEWANSGHVFTSASPPEPDVQPIAD